MTDRPLKSLPKNALELAGWDWQDIEAHYLALESVEPTPDGVEAWLASWSRLKELIEEALSRLRVAKMLDTADESREARFNAFLERIYTPTEVTYCRGRVAELAARFAAKEAVSKALGTGLRGIDWREMEILPDRRGKPLVTLHGRAGQRAAALGLTHFALSLSHSREYAI
ncbi:MAG: holo-ACP synthase, partial [Acidobacteriota bacterium]